MAHEDARIRPGRRVPEAELSAKAVREEEELQIRGRCPGNLESSPEGCSPAELVGSQGVLQGTEEALKCFIYFILFYFVFTFFIDYYFF